MAKERSIRQLKTELDLIKQESEYSKDIATSLSQYFKTQKDISKLHEQLNKQQALWNKINESANESLKKTKKLLGEELKEEEKILSDLEDQLDIVGQQMRIEKSRLAQMGSQLTLGNLIKSGLGSILSITQELTGLNIKEELSAKRIVKWLIEQQKSLKQLNLQLGISGEKAELMRKTISDTAFQTQVLGVGVKELTEIQAGLADETGRVRAMTVQSQTAIAEIAAGTKLGTQEAGKLAGQFQNIGIDAIKSNKIVQGIVDQSERMGINTTKVLKSVIDNFKTAQKFYFKRGIQALSEMAAYAEKFKIDMTSTFATAEKARTLEGGIEMAAQLRLAGGEFSKVDPFRLLFLARTDAAKFQETLQQMTKNVAIFNKETGQFDISAVDLDRLRIVSEATGKSLEELSLTAKRTAEIEMARKQIPGFRGMNKELQESIEGMVEWNSEQKKFMIMGKDISKFNKEQLNNLKVEKESLEARAKQAIAFDDAFKNLTNTIKSAFLPLIDGLNWITSGIQKITEGVKGLGPILTMVLYGIGAAGFMGLGKIILGVIPNLISMNLQMKIMGGTMSKFSSFSKGMPKGGIMGSLFGGVGFGGIAKGALMLGIAAGGLSLFGLALQQFQGIDWKTLGIAGTAIVGLTGAIFGLGALLTATGGIGAIIFGAGVAGFAAMGASLWVVAGAMKTLSEANIPTIGEGFDVVTKAVQAIDIDKLEEIQKTAEALRNLSVTAGLFGGLGNLFQDGITVKFKDNQVALNVDVTSEIDGEVFARKTASKVMGVIEENNYYKTRA